MSRMTKKFNHVGFHDMSCNSHDEGGASLIDAFKKQTCISGCMG